MTLLTRIALVLIAAMMSALVSFRAPALIVHNRSPSTPTGFYVRVDRTPVVGDYVTVPVPALARAYAASRDFGDESDRFLKRVAAGEGQTVCAIDDTVTIDGRTPLRRVERDGVGHPLPTWEGCRELARDEVFLIGDTDQSFDGRYWGVTARRDIDGVWRHLGRQGG